MVYVEIEGYQGKQIVHPIHKEAYVSTIIIDVFQSTHPFSLSI